jgi:hypothetical protein
MSPKRMLMFGKKTLLAKDSSDEVVLPIVALEHFLIT